jgi:prephenate dehydrogenase
VRALWSDAGATRFLTLTPREHDGAVAYASHLPALAAASVFAALEQAGASGKIARALAAGGFRDTTRLAADGTVGQAAVHNRFLPEVLRASAASLNAFAAQIEDGLHSNDLAALARTLEQLADRRRAMRLPPRR